MDLKDIASIAGRSGLYKIVKPTRNGVIVETLDDKKSKAVFGSTSRVSILKEVSIYTTDSEGSVPLGEVLKRIYEKYEDKLELSNKSSGAELQAFLEEIVPDYDVEKVYASDMKKLVAWYQIILKYAPQTLENLVNPQEEDKQEEASEEEQAEGDIKTAD